jgi:hypothetical protein
VSVRLKQQQMGISVCCSSKTSMHSPQLVGSDWSVLCELLLMVVGGRVGSGVSVGPSVSQEPWVRMLLSARHT